MQFNDFESWWAFNRHNYENRMLDFALAKEIADSAEEWYVPETVDEQDCGHGDFEGDVTCPKCNSDFEVNADIDLESLDVTGQYLTVSEAEDLIEHLQSFINTYTSRQKKSDTK